MQNEKSRQCRQVLTSKTDITIKTKELTAHLRRHAIPELIDDNCLAAFDNIDAQFGETDTYTGILEVRLGEKARYVDFSILRYDKNTPIPSPMWYEFDHEQFATVKKIEPCLLYRTVLRYYLLNLCSF